MEMEEGIQVLDFSQEEIVEQSDSADEFAGGGDDVPKTEEIQSTNQLQNLESHSGTWIGLIILAVVFIQVLNAGHSLMVKAALNHGMHPPVYALYRNVIAAIILWMVILVRRPAMPTLAFSLAWRVVLLAILEPVVDQNMAYLSLKSTNAGFSACMAGLGPVITFLIALVMRMERLQIHVRSTHMKLIGAAVTIIGASLMTIKSPKIAISSPNGASVTTTLKKENWIEGPILVVIAVFSGAFYNVLLGNTLKKYPNLIPVIAGSTSIGAIVNFLLLLILKDDLDFLLIKWNLILVTYLYGGIAISSVGFWMVGWLIEKRGAVFVASFSPLSMTLVLLVSVFILKGVTHVASIVGLVVVISGLAVFLWGKSQDSPTKSQTTQDEELG